LTVLFYVGAVDNTAILV